jgi:hypothetical protein
VDDATTAQLMSGFYRALQRGQGRAAALRTAQLELLALGRERPAEYGAYRHPAYWAPFVLIGEWGRLSGLPGQGPELCGEPVEPLVEGTCPEFSEGRIDDA